MQLQVAQKNGTSRLPKKQLTQLTQPLSQHCYHFRMLLELSSGISQVVDEFCGLSKFIISLTCGLVRRWKAQNHIFTS